MKITKIYFDMDGVLADFGRGVNEICGIPLPDQNAGENDDEMWKKIKEAGDFYYRLELMPGALEMYRRLSSQYSVEILSAVPRPKRGITAAGDDKIRWAHEKLSPDLKVNIVVGAGNKAAYAGGRDYILIDDLKSNIEKWNSYGGTGVLFTTAEDTLKAIEKIAAE